MSRDGGPDSAGLCSEFLSHVGPGAALAAEGLEAALAEAIDSARVAWPTFQLASPVFLQYLAQRLPPSPPEGSIHALQAVRTADLYLACGCAQQLPAALSALEEFHLSKLPAVLRSIDPSTSFADDVKQRLREKLLMPRDGRPPAIQDYSGRGPLQTWLRSAAVRTALNLRAGQRPQVTLEEHAFLELTGPSAAPELALLRERVRPAFSRSFQSALQALTPEQRNLMRLHLLDGLGIDQLAPLFQTHRSTVARWIARNREQIAEHTRTALEEELQLPREELDEVMSLVRSQLDLSIQRFLQATQG